MYVGVLCPGPVATEFDNVANVSFSLKGLSSEFVAKYAVNKMFKKKMVIVPGVTMKIARFLEKIAPEKCILMTAYHMQKRKRG